VIGLCGCVENATPAYDRFQSLLIQRVFEELALGETKQAVTLLQRLGDMAPDQPFYRLALAHEQERETLSALNGLVSAGKFVAAQQHVRQRSLHGGAPASLTTVEALAGACQSMEAYGRLGPFAGSESAREAMTAFRGSDTLLLTSSVYRSWLAEQEATVEALAAEERAVVLRQLCAAYDHAVVSGSVGVDAILGQVTALSPDHPLVTLTEAGLCRRWRDLLREPVPGDEEGQFAFQVTACQFWAELGAAERKTVCDIVRQQDTCSLSGVLLEVLSAVELGDFAVASVSLRELAPSVSIAPHWVAWLVERGIGRHSHFQAGCWRTPFPSVPDMVNRVIQLRERYVEERR